MDFDEKVLAADPHVIYTVKVEERSQEGAVLGLAAECILIDVHHLNGRELTPKKRKSTFVRTVLFTLCR